MSSFKLEDYGLRFRPKLDTSDNTYYGEDSIANIIMKTRSTEENSKKIELYLQAIEPFDIFYKAGLLLPNIEEACNTIMNSMDNNGRIVEVCDFDNDGLNSGAVVNKAFLYGIGYKNVTTICTRRKQGTGITNRVVEQILAMHGEANIDVLLVTDHGSNDIESYAIIKEKIPNIKIIVMDHHEVQDEENSKKYIDHLINPMLKSQPTFLEQEGEISGCSVSYLTMLVLSKKLDILKDKTAYMVMRALLINNMTTVISDVMDVSTPLNRLFVKVGLDVMNSNIDKMWMARAYICGLPTNYRYKDISFNIAPMVNTGNRLDNENVALSFLMTDDIEHLKFIGNKLSDLNSYRKMTIGTVASRAEQLMVGIDGEPTSGIVMLIDTKEAIGGIVAARIGEKYNLPAICFNSSVSGILTGSCRGIVKDFSILHILEKIAQEDDSIIVGYGGHTGAAGVSIYNNKLEIFAELFYKFCKEELDKLEKDDMIDVDLVYVPDGTDFINKLANSIEKVSPYGKRWPEPVIVSEFKVSNIRTFSGDQHRISVYIDGFFEIDFSYYGNIDFTIGDKIIVAYKINTKVIKREVKNLLDPILMKKIKDV